jgi:hypothetical protein
MPTKRIRRSTAAAVEELSHHKAALQQIRLDLQNIKRDNGQEYKCSERSILTVKAILCLTKGRRERAITYLVDRRRVPAATATDVVQKQFEWYCAAAQDGCEQWPGVAATSARHRSAIRQARAFMGEERLFRWVEEQNIGKGLAPCSASVLLREENDTVEPVVPRSAVSTQRRSKLQWLRRWRRRWSTRLGTIALRERVANDIMQRKACVRDHVVSPNDTQLVTQIRQQCGQRLQKGGQYTAPILGPP